MFYYVHASEKTWGEVWMAEETVRELEFRQLIQRLKEARRICRAVIPPLLKECPSLEAEDLNPPASESGLPLEREN